MALSDLIKLIRHYLKVVVAIPLVCIVLSVLVVLIMPPTYVAKSVLLTSGDVALAGGFAQSEATFYSQDGIEVTTSTESSRRMINIEAEGTDYGGCIAAANATVLAAADACRAASNTVTVTTNEATYAEVASLSVPKVAFMALAFGLIVAFCFIVIVDAVKTPIKSKKDIEAVSSLPVIGTIPNRDRGERLLANIRFITDEPPKTIAVVPTGHVGASLTCAEVAIAFENAGFPASRVQGSAHAQGIGTTALPGIVSIIECPPLSEGVGAIYIAREADITILCVREWTDSRKALKSVEDELNFAKANIGGVVFLADKYKSKGFIW